VLRDSALPGAVLTRVAASHLRVGTFEYFAAREDHGALRALVDFAIARHAPALADAENPAQALLQHVADTQAALLAQWLSVGFIHGVMNTDNMALSGETIDYGPCAFMDHYHPQTVFSSIDHRGRYAFSNQPTIAQWNLARFAETLVPLIHTEMDVAVERASTIVLAFNGDFEARFLGRMRAKLGLFTTQETDTVLINRLLSLMQHSKADFTQAFRRLGDAALGPAHEAPLRSLFTDQTAIEAWLADWRARLLLEARSMDNVRMAMQRVNPLFIPRNHRVEHALNAASDRCDMAPFLTLLAVVQRPFDDQPEHTDLATPPRDDERVHATFCGT
jgi:serine/tyrosine/threonine adenylyltransferase